MRLLLLIFLLCPVLAFSDWDLRIPEPEPERHHPMRSMVDINISTINLEHYGFCLEIYPPLIDKNSKQSKPYYSVALVFPSTMQYDGESEAEYRLTQAKAGDITLFESSGNLSEKYGFLLYYPTPSMFEDGTLEISYARSDATFNLFFKLHDLVPEYLFKDINNLGNLRWRCEKKHQNREQS